MGVVLTGTSGNLTGNPQGFHNSGILPPMVRISTPVGILEQGALIPMAHE